MCVCLTAAMSIGAPRIGIEEKSNSELEINGNAQEEMFPPNGNLAVCCGARLNGSDGFVLYAGHVPRCFGPASSSSAIPRKLQQLPRRVLFDPRCLWDKEECRAGPKVTMHALAVKVGGKGVKRESRTQVIWV